MPGEVDLHIHSNRSSDGDFSPFHIVHLARRNGFLAISIADHDSVAAYPEAVEHGEREGVEVIPGLELTTVFDHREFHLLLPFVDWKSKTLGDIIERVHEARYQEAKERVTRMQEIGIELSWDEVMVQMESKPPLGVAIAQILLGKPESRRNPVLEKYYLEENRLLAPYIFYKDYFMEGRPAAVPRRNISLLEVLDLVPQTGGVPVVAHPGAYFQRATREDLSLLRERGLQGLEVFSSYHDRDKTQLYGQMAKELDLVPTAGSDFHGKIKSHVPFGYIKEGEYWMVERLRERKKG